MNDWNAKRDNYRRLRKALGKAVAILETIFEELGDPPANCQADFVEIVNVLRETTD